MLVPVMSLAVHVPCLAVVLQIDLQSLVDHALLELFVEHRKTDLDAAEKIPVHPVRAGEIHVMLQIIAEIEDAGVFEKTSDHRAHPDVLRQSRHPGTQRAHTAHDQIHLHAGLGSFVKRVDGFRLQQRIHLGDDVGALAGLGEAGFVLYGAQHLDVHAKTAIATNG